MKQIALLSLCLLLGCAGASQESKNLRKASALWRSLEDPRAADTVRFGVLLQPMLTEEGIAFLVSSLDSDDSEAALFLLSLAYDLLKDSETQDGRRIFRLLEESPLKTRVEKQILKDVRPSVRLPRLRPLRRTEVGR